MIQNQRQNLPDLTLFVKWDSITNFNRHHRYIFKKTITLSPTTLGRLNMYLNKSIFEKIQNQRLSCSVQFVICNFLNISIPKPDRYYFTDTISNYFKICSQAPEQWAIWIGPAQQSDSSSLCAAHPCR